MRDDPPAPSRGGRGETLNEFFVDGKGIHREVLQREICKYLGPEAYSRPYNYNVRGEASSRLGIISLTCM